MAKRCMALLMASLVLSGTLVSGCAGASSDSAEFSSPATEESTSQSKPESTADDNNEEEPMSRDAARASRVSATLNGTEFIIDLADNPTAKAFASTLPMECELSELNGNEKYVLLDEALPSDPTNPGTIEAGDVMLYQNAYIVVFYETHAADYAYSRIGRIENPNGLSAAVGTGSVRTSFTLLQ